MNKIKIISRDNVSFDLDLKIIKKSEFLVDKIELGENVVNLTNIDSCIIEKIVAYLVYHSEIEDTKKWDIQFIKKFNGDELIDLLWVSNYLKIEDLTSLGRKFLISTIENNNIASIRKKLHIKSDFTEEEEQKIYADFIWQEIN